LAAEPCGQLSQPSDAGARTAELGKFTTLDPLPTLFSIVPKKNADNTITIEQVDYHHTPYVTILQMILTEDVYTQPQLGIGK
ncbi:hypothetical protein HQ447_18665, partial [bacterium]|nr:hypothetical protein [bacterium]